MTLRRRRGRPFLLSATVDFPDDLEGASYTPALLADAFRLLRDAGVRRVNWLDYGSVDPASPLFNPILLERRHGPATIAALGDPLGAAVAAAHANGLELFAVIKPFAGATVITRRASTTGHGLERIGGVMDDPFQWLERQPHLRIARDPATLPPPGTRAPTHRDVASIRLTKSDDSPTRITPADLEIYSSVRNDRYRRRRHLETFSVREEVRPARADVRDYFGRLLTRAGAPVRSLVLENVRLDEPFTLITTGLRETDGRGEKPDFRNTARQLLEAFDADGRPLPIVVATRSATANLNRDFRQQGLEFDCGYGLFEYALDADNRAASQAWDEPQGGCVAFGVGHNAHLGGSPSESEPEVQEAWLAWVQRCIDAGVDGVDIRVSAHGSHTDDPFAFGFGPAVLSAVGLQRPAGAPPADADTLGRIARVRGDRYTQFLRRARVALRAAGIPLHVHLHTEAFRPDPVHGQLMGFPANLEFQWQTWLEEGLVDGATLRTAWYERLGPPVDDLAELLREDVVAGTVAEARRHGIPLQLNRYAMDGNTRRTGVRAERYLDDLEVAFRDERLAGFDLYELWALAAPTRDGRRMEPITELLPRIGDTARRLGIA